MLDFGPPKHIARLANRLPSGGTASKDIPTPLRGYPSISGRDSSDVRRFSVGVVPQDPGPQPAAAESGRFLELMD